MIPVFCREEEGGSAREKLGYLSSGRRPDRKADRGGFGGQEVEVARRAQSKRAPHRRLEQADLNTLESGLRGRKIDICVEIVGCVARHWRPALRLVEGAQTETASGLRPLAGDPPTGVYDSASSLGKKRGPLQEKEKSNPHSGQWKHLTRPRPL